MKLERLSDQPILRPKKNRPWEAGAVFNCAAIYDKGLVHLIYRATDIASNGKKGKYINSLGYAVSKNGVDFNRLEEPILANDVPQELRGPEDPRVVKVNGTFYMMYTGYGGRFDGDYRICLATSENLISWTRQGVVLDEENKDASLFPQKIDGKWVMLHRRAPDIWLAFSDNLKNWTGHIKIMGPILDSSWENKKIGIAGPPIETKDGWLLIYHAVDADHRYRLGAALLDRDNPACVLARYPKPILEAELDWEVNGYIPNVVFSCGQAVIGDDIYVYYGGADTVIGVAGMRIGDISF